MRSIEQSKVISNKMESSDIGYEAFESSQLPVSDAFFLKVC